MFQSAKIDKKSHVCKKKPPFSMFFKIISCQIQKKIVILRRISQKNVTSCDGELSKNKHYYLLTT